jgi:hypothetical protein
VKALPYITGGEDVSAIVWYLLTLAVVLMGMVVFDFMKAEIKGEK